MIYEDIVKEFENKIGAEYFLVVEDNLLHEKFFVYIFPDENPLDIGEAYNYKRYNILALYDLSKPLVEQSDGFFVEGE
jgi:hypothetical protein